MSVRRLVLVSASALAAGAGLLLVSQSASAADSVSLTGQLVVAHEDDFSHSRSRHSFGLETADGARTTLRFTDESKAHALAGREVTISGQRRGNVVYVAAAQGTGGRTNEAPATTSGQVKLGVVLLSFKDKPLLPTADALRPLVFGTDMPTVDSYFRENSLGQQSMTGTVFETVTISALSTGACDYLAWAQEARALSKINEADYTHIAHVLPPATSCNWSGLAYTPGKYSWTTTNGVGTESQVHSFRGIMEHELGHNFSAHHGGSLSCTADGVAVTLSSTCTLAEYGDPFTAMGQAWGERHFNAFQKGTVSSYAPNAGRAPWLLAANTQAVTADTTVTLAPLEKSATGVQVLRIPKPGSRSDFYYVEYRDGSGFDAGTRSRTYTDPTNGETTLTNSEAKGVTVRIAPAYGTRAVSRLLDMTPRSAEGFRDAALDHGQEFVDGSVTIRNVLTSEVQTIPTIQVTFTTTSKPKGRK